MGKRPGLTSLVGERVSYISNSSHNIINFNTGRWGFVYECGIGPEKTEEEEYYSPRNPPCTHSGWGEGGRRGERRGESERWESDYRNWERPGGWIVGGGNSRMSETLLGARQAIRQGHPRWTKEAYYFLYSSFWK